MVSKIMKSGSIKEPPLKKRRTKLTRSYIDLFDKAWIF